MREDVPLEGKHGGMVVMHLHKELVDDGRHVGVVEPALQNGPLSALDVHLHHHRILGLKLELLFDEPRDVDRVFAVGIRDERAVELDAGRHPGRHSRGDVHADGVRILRDPVGVLVEGRRGELEEARGDLPRVNLREIAWVHALEP